MAGDKIYLAGKVDLDNHIANGNHPIIVTTEGTGEAYTATVEGITELTVGALLVIIPHINSASISATLDVNGLGAKHIRQVTSYASAAAVQPKSAGFLGKGKPVLLMYNGTYWLQATARANMLDAYGKLAIENGGTGADNAADALANLGAASASHNHDASNITSGTLPVARGGTGQTTLEPAIGTAAARAIYAGTGDMTAGSTSLTTGRIYLVYE